MARTRSRKRKVGSVLERRLQPLVMRTEGERRIERLVAEANSHLVRGATRQPKKGVSGIAEARSYSAGTDAALLMSACVASSGFLAGRPSDLPGLVGARWLAAKTLNHRGPACRSAPNATERSIDGLAVSKGTLADDEKLLW